MVSSPRIVAEETVNGRGKSPEGETWALGSLDDLQAELWSAFLGAGGEQPLEEHGEITQGDSGLSAIESGEEHVVGSNEKEGSSRRVQGLTIDQRCVSFKAQRV